MDKSKIQAACGQYSLGFSTCLGPSGFSHHQSLTKGERKADGWMSEFYEEGYEDAARGTRIALNDKPPMFVGRKANLVQTDDESQQERRLLAKLRDCLAANPAAPSEQVIAIIGAETESIMKAFESERLLDEARARLLLVEAADRQAREEAEAARLKAIDDAAKQKEHEAFLLWQAEQAAAKKTLEGG